MTLRVHTARVSCAAPDGLDITQRSGGARGRPFAPSPALFAQARRMPWLGYRRAFLGEMLVSAAAPVPASWNADVERARSRGVRPCPEAWQELLACESVTLLCYCVDYEHGHRTLVAQVLERLGATHGGEVGIAEVERAVRALDGASALDLVRIFNQAGAEWCVAWERLRRLGLVQLSYDELKAHLGKRGMRELRAATGSRP